MARLRRFPTPEAHRLRPAGEIPAFLAQRSSHAYLPNPYQSPLSRLDHPVRIRLYGLFPTTRATYMKVQALGFMLLAGLLVAWFFVRPLPLWSNPSARILWKLQFP